MARSHLLQELDDILTQNLISEEQHQDIKQYLQLKKASPLSSIPILPLMGVILICAGIIAIAASNWVHFGVPLKLFVAFVPLLLSSLALVATKERSSALLTECLALSVGMLLLLAFGIISNIYQTPLSTEFLMQVVIAALVPLVYVYKTYWLAAVLLTGVLYGAHQDYLLLSLLGLLVFAPILLEKVREGDSVRLLTLLQILALFRLVILLFESNDSILLLLGLLMVASLFYEEESFQKIIGFTSAWFMFALTLENGWVMDEVEYFLPLAVCYIVFASMLFGVAGYRFLRKEYTVLTAKRYGMYGVALVTALQPLRFLTILAIVAFLAFDSMFYYKEGVLKKYNQKSTLLTLFILYHMAWLDLPFMVKGVLFILTGVGFLVVSLSVSSKMKRGDIYG